MSAIYSIQTNSIESADDFGIFQIKMNEAPMNKTPIAIHFTIDSSASMEEGTYKGSKMNFVLNTMSNILHVIVAREMPISVQIDQFNNNYSSVIPLTAVSKENISELFEKIVKIRPDGSTNMAKAIQESQKAMSSAEFSGFVKKYHFFLTDGEATIGETNIDKLAEMISPDFITMFIGYGIDHNAQLLISGAKKNPKSSYHFVNDFETIGVLCGELLHGFCYPVVFDATITVQNGVIYDAFTNTWQPCTNIGDLVEGKTYRIPVRISDDFEITISDGRQFIESVKGIAIDSVDLTRDVFQFQVDKLFFESTERDVKADAKELFSKIAIQRDNSYKCMMDDLYTLYRTVGTDVGNMYIHSRIGTTVRRQHYRTNSSGISANNTQVATSIGRQNSCTMYDERTIPEWPTDAESVLINPLIDGTTAMAADTLYGTSLDGTLLDGTSLDDTSLDGTLLDIDNYVPDCDSTQIANCEMSNTMSSIIRDVSQKY